MQSIYETALDEFHVAITAPVIWLFVSSCKSRNLCTAIDERNQFPGSIIGYRVNWSKRMRIEQERTNERTSYWTNEAKRKNDSRRNETKWIDEKNWTIYTKRYEINRDETRTRIETKRSEMNRTKRNEAKSILTRMRNENLNVNVCVDNKRRVLYGYLASAG